MVGLIRRSFSYLDPMSFKKLYSAFVRPHLEYCQSVWSPHLQKHINKLENVQIRATKLVNNLGDLEYEDRLRQLNLPTLQYRRFRGDMIELYKHFNTYDKDCLSSSFQPRTRTTRTHNFQLMQNKTKDGSRGVQTNSFYHRTTRSWNNLPAEVVNAKDLNTFKNKLDETMGERIFKINFNLER